MANKLELVNVAKAQKVEDIHALVNSSMTEQLRANMVMARRVADMTNLPEDLAMANEAAEKWEAHRKANSALVQTAVREKVAFAAGVKAEQEAPGEVTTQEVVVPVSERVETRTP